MRNHYSGSMMAATAAVALLLAGASIAGQGQSGYKAPRTADGKANLNGIWQALNTANWDIAGHAAQPAPFQNLVGVYLAEPAGLGVVDGGAIPYKPEMAAKKKENQDKWLERDPEVKCYLPGVPRANYMPQPFQILQSPSAIFFAYQYAGAVRNVYLKNPGPPPVDSWMGQSVARWEGDTLVIDVTGFNDSTWFDRAGNFHSDQLHVVERYTRTAPDALTYEATIEDPKTFTRPWKISMPLYRRLEKNVQLMDFKCVEFVEELLYGQWRKKPLSK